MTPRSIQFLKFRYFAFLWIILIYSTLYIVRPISDFFNANTPFTELINGFIVCLMIVFLFNFWKIRSGCSGRTYILLLIAISSYLYGICKMEIAVEKIHFIEYGVLSYLIYMASRTDFSPRRSYLISLVLTSVFGWIDEGIQHLLPNRYYQLSDVALNSISGALGLMLVAAFRQDCEKH